MKLVTGNDLASGEVIWWTGTGWSPRIEDAVDAADIAEVIAQTEEAARRVNVPYVIEASRVGGVPRPAHIKDRVRAFGPSVRPDLSLKPGDPQALAELL